MPIKEKEAGAETCRYAFGAVLTQQGRGYYVALELLAIAWGTHALKQPLLPSTGKIRYRRRSHDFARRIMADEPLRAEEERHLRGDGTRAILQSLLESLRVPIPNRRELPDWLGQHLYPYMGELMHYDAAYRDKRKRIGIERYTYRGAGGLAHKILRTDPDLDRLAANRAGLLRLVQPAGGPLGQIADACSKHDAAEAEEFTDEMEARTEVHATCWVEHLREGVRNITSRGSVRAKQVELLVHWVPYCIARHQLDRAAQLVGRDPMMLPAALVARSSPLRQVARRTLDQARGVVEEALKVVAQQVAAAADAGEAPFYAALASKRGWRSPFVAFLSQTLATVGALNAHVGTRYLTLQLSLLEALVCATLHPEQTMRLEDFCDRLHSDYGIVAGPRTPCGSGPLARMDAADLEENAEQLAADLEGLGLLTAYSDATRMVHGEVI